MMNINHPDLVYFYVISTFDDQIYLITEYINNESLLSWLQKQQQSSIRESDLFNKAAEMATAAMKGRLANKYYMSAEEAYGLEPDEESEDS
ncbi:unnamed protein product [Rotaria sp. Silwood2]|nr:unnamed protein product [Rotaria sp. Silwood2]